MSPEEVGSWIPFVCKVAYDAWGFYRGMGSEWTDCRSEALLCLVRVSREYFEVASFKTVLAKEVRRAVGRYLRRRERSREIPLSALEGFDVECRDNDRGEPKDVSPLLRLMTDRQREVVVLRLGLEGNEEHTLDGVSAATGLCKNRVFQAFESGIYRARALSRNKESGKFGR